MWGWMADCAIKFKQDKYRENPPSLLSLNFKINLPKIDDKENVSRGTSMKKTQAGSQQRKRINGRINRFHYVTMKSCVWSEHRK